MSDSVIKVNNLSKRYRIGVQQKADTFSEQLKNTITYPIRNLKRIANLSKFDKADETVFWALKDINFEVKQGEVLGIIGHNGAGKSTLLKILSRITEPTTGRIEIKGRVSALLEVGTGFHPELTGRDNIYMNGTILGMRKREIDSKLDEIIAFSGVEKHIDTPVKFYSSGMRVRLAFSVAAHLEPEILIIDEVLAVGDAEFQKKCLGKMEDVASQGRTVLFVSHNMAAIGHLCTCGLVLNNGEISFYGNINAAIGHYVRAEESKFSFNNGGKHINEGRLRFKSIKINDRNGKSVNRLITGQKYSFDIIIHVIENMKLRGLKMTFKNSMNHVVYFVLNSGLVVEDVIKLQAQRLYSVSYVLEKLPLHEGQFTVDISTFTEFGVENKVEGAFIFNVEAGDYYGTGKSVKVKEGVLIPYDVDINEI